MPFSSSDIFETTDSMQSITSINNSFFLIAKTLYTADNLEKLSEE